ncbi:MAG TPA: small ribosomal subunit Rsm22 family protein [Methanoregula sp.]|nr:small ribosomal subunit Rsm22 family protein [Methanoregula sp.]
MPAEPVPHAYLLTPDEEKRLADFFTSGNLPPALGQAIEQYITHKVGRPWNDPVILERIRKAIIGQKDDYWKPVQQRSLQYTKAYSVLGYLTYHFPVYFMQTEHLLAMLAREGLLKKSMAILDAGTGPGVVPFAIADFWSRLDGAKADVYSVERSEEHIEAFRYLRDRFVPKGGGVSIKSPVKADITVFDPAKVPRALDLIIFSNILNELCEGDINRRADLVMKYADRLHPEGTILIVEPAEEVTSTQLRRLSLALRKRGLTIHSPCSFVHGTNCTPDRCWSFVTEQNIRPTRIMENLAACSEPYRYVNTDIKYSYTVIRKDGRIKEPFRVPPGSRTLRLSQVHRYLDTRVDILAAKMSENLGDGKTVVFRICDGSAEKPVFAVIPAYHVTTENRILITAPYGSVLELRDVLVRYNTRHDAFNLLVNRNSKIGLPGIPDRI